MTANKYELLDQLNVLKSKFDKIYENIVNALYDNEFETYIWDYCDTYPHETYEKDIVEIQNNSKQVDNYFKEIINNIKKEKLIDDNDKKRIEAVAIERTLTLFKSSYEIMDKYNSIFEELCDIYEDYDDNDSTERELDAKNSSQGFMEAQLELNKIREIYNTKKDESDKAEETPKKIKNFFKNIETKLDINFGPFSATFEPKTKK